MRKVAFVLDSSIWLGGVNYYRNLITALSLIENPKIKVVVFIPSDAPSSLVQDYGDVCIIRSKFLAQNTALGFIRRSLRKLFFQKDYVLELLLNCYKVDLISHFSGELPHSSKILKIGWIPDFQHIHLKKYFTESDLRARDQFVHGICTNSDQIILSSESAESDLRNEFGYTKNNVSVLRFVPDVSVRKNPKDREFIKSKYGIKNSYIYLPNQFWVHKNHMAVIKALSLLKETQYPITVVASGSTEDYRDSSHFEKVKQMARDLGVEDQFKVLGVVPYDDLITLMIHSIAVLNPSFFEGWSTTVEEAKALNKTILLSDIPVHREQNPKHGVFFDPESPEKLAAAMSDLVALGQVERAEEGPSDTRLARLNFAEEYQKIVLKTCATSTRHQSAAG